MSENTQRQINSSQILAMLAEGKDRKAIKEELGISHAEMRYIFSHPSLKNAKPKKDPSASFVFVDDVAGEVAHTVTEADVVANDGDPALAESVGETVVFSQPVEPEEVAKEEAQQEPKDAISKTPEWMK